MMLGTALGPAWKTVLHGAAQASGPRPGEHARRHVGRSQCSVPCFEQHAFQKQLAVTLHVGLVQPQGQVAQGEVVVRGVCELFSDAVLQAELLLIHVGQLAGNLV